VRGDDADQIAGTADDRNGEERLELLLLELGDVRRPRVVERVLADERRLASFGSPPRESLALLERHAADVLLVGRRGRAQDEALSVVLQQVDEARVHSARLGHEANDGAQDFGELERRVDRGDDLVQDPLAGVQRHLQGDRMAAAGAVASRVGEIGAMPPSAALDRREGGVLLGNRYDELAPDVLLAEAA
jgi:hypothetical protein